MKRLIAVAATLLVPLVVIAGQAQSTAPVDREYTLESTMLGYRGVGGQIDGIRNPTLWARTGETVRITIVNGELMVHDVTLEKLNVRSAQILDKGATSSVTFKAKDSDTYYCSLPGHRAAGMEGRLEVSDQPPVQSAGVTPVANGRALNLDFETGTLQDWTATGDAFALVKEDTARKDQRAAIAGVYWVSSGVAGNSRKGTLWSAPFRVTHPYASFLVSGGAFASTRVE
nr:cupredoxin domain-containing protein [Acidobacteriota bacterium]